MSALLCTAPVVSFAENAASGGSALPEVVVTAPRIEDPALLANAGLAKAALNSLRAANSDAASLMEGVAGVTLYRGGGVSSLPVVHGMADDRVRVNVDGRELPSACGNHMNPPLSYIDPSNVAKVEVMGGITPVSAGGDSIGGTIAVQSVDPVFAKAGAGVLTKGRVSGFARSNGEHNGGNLAATLATEHLSLTAQGSLTRAGDYRDGHDQKVQSTSFAAENESVQLGARGNGHLFRLDLGRQDIPYQDFVNAQMDMIGNQAKFVNGRYEGQFGWGKLDAQLHWQNTEHQMNVRGDKILGRNMDMPMNTDGTTSGYSLKLEIDLSEGNTLRVGNEFIHFVLDDWWPPSPGQLPCVANNCSMAPGTFWNIRNGRRDRLGTYLEWSSRWNDRWSSLVGVRSDYVRMNTDDVVGYNTTLGLAGVRAYQEDATAFNGRDHERTDMNFDLTALLRFDPTTRQSYEAGYARKTRSPNLYERYLWTRSSMSARMNSAAGDANGYVGDPDLKPEVAHTLSFTASWHDAARKQWEIKATPYYTHVEDFIDADRCTGGTGCTAANRAATAGLVNLQYANHDARLYGLDLSARSKLGPRTPAGDFALTGVLGYVNGKNSDTGDHLYHIMPLNARLGLEHALDNWSNRVELQVVDRKDAVSATRNELRTGGYGLVNVKTGYQWKQVRLDAGIDNLFDKYYNAPLGGVYWVGDGSGNTPVPGPGRSAYIGMTMEF
ncbi:MAG: TonB-dependent receptor [Magnetococcales bacterium]|nr:TonB-dependent receptor [Magnetococcales bacterium]